MKKILILAGGYSKEKEVSIQTAKSVYSELKKDKNIKLKFDYENFAKEMSHKSNVQIYLVNDKNNLAKFVKQNIYGNKVVIGMGAGSISNWIKELPQII